MNRFLQAFSEPRDGAGVDVLFVAGEHSGDEHAALIAAEMLRDDPGLRIAALGGPALEEAGAQLLFDLTASSVVGLVEVLKNYGFFKELFDKILNWIEKWRPRIVCFVDYPGFNVRLAEALRERQLSRKGGGDVFIYYYISPQIWAWKAKRRFKIAATVDELGAIFPFEPDYYADTDLLVSFVGHPFVAAGHESRLRYDAEGPVLLLPGSRQQPVQRIFPPILRAWSELVGRGVGRRAAVIYPSAFIHSLQQDLLRAAPESVRETVDFVPAASVQAASAVLTSSGTMSMNCALAAIPGAIVYRAHPVTYWIGRRVVKIPYLGIANIILNREMYPEYLQGAARPEALADRVEAALNDASVVAKTRADAQELRERLQAPQRETVARRLIQLLQGRVPSS